MNTNDVVAIWAAAIMANIWAVSHKPRSSLYSKLWFVVCIFLVINGWMNVWMTHGKL